MIKTIIFQTKKIDEYIKFKESNDKKNYITNKKELDLYNNLKKIMKN